MSKMSEYKSDDESSKSGMTAKKDFVLNCPQTKKADSYRKDIKKGDDLLNVPKKFHKGLKTEGVL